MCLLKMSSIETERWIPTSDQELSIPELIDLIRYSFRQFEFNKVQNILMNRDKEMKIKIENLKRGRDSIQEEARFLERTHGLAELEKLKLEEKLHRSQRKCEELKVTITKLTEEQRLSSDRSTWAEKQVYEENSNMSNEKNKLIFEFNEKINELENKKLESEQLVGVYQEILKSADTSLVKMEQEIECLRHEKLAANQTVEKLRRKQMESDKVVEELKRQNLDATQTVDELRQQKMESDKRLEARIMKVEASLANLLNVKVKNLANVVDTIDNSAAAAFAAEGGNVGLPDTFKGEKDSSANGSTNSDAEDVVVKSPGLCSFSNSAGSEGIGSPKEGRRYLVHLWIKEDNVKKVWSSPVSQSGSNPPDVINNCTAQDNEGSLASVVRWDGEVPASDIIEVCDSDDDDETKPGEAAYISGTSSGQRKKRNRIESGQDSAVTKGKKCIFIIGNDNSPIDEKENQVVESCHGGNASLHMDGSVKLILDTTGLSHHTRRRS